MTSTGLDACDPTTPIRVQLPDGSWLSVVLRKRAAPACVCIHGFGDNACVWDGVIDHSRSAFRYVAPDLRGHGDSDHDPTGRYRVGDHAGDIAALCEALGLGRVVLAGHSMGAAAALHLAAQGRLDLAGLILVDLGIGADVGLLSSLDRPSASTACFADAGEYAEQLALAQPLAERRLLERYALSSLRPDRSGGYVLKRDPSMRLDGDLLGAPDGSAMWAALAVVDCPILCVRGAASAVMDRSTLLRMEGASLDVTTRVVAGAGHAVPLDNPAGLASAMDDFLAGLS